MASDNVVISEIIASNAPQTAAQAHTKTGHSVDETGLDDGQIHTVYHPSRDEEQLREQIRRVSLTDPTLYPPPTEEEHRTLRKIADSIPKTAYLLCIVEFAERASYYGAKNVVSNFLQFPLPPGGNGAGAPPRGSELTAGALGQGIQFANAIILLFSFLSYVIPIFGAWLADTKLGRFKAILLGVLVGGVSHIIMIAGAIPSVLQAGKGLAPFMVSFMILAIGAGIFKPNVSPTILDQYRHQVSYTRVLKSGEKVIVDPEITVQRIMLWFYGFVNIGAFFGLVTTYSEKYVGYWLAYLETGIIYLLLPLLMWYLWSRLIKYPPQGSVLPKFFKICWTATKRSRGKFWHKDFWKRAQPSVLRADGVEAWKGREIPWTDKDVDDVYRTVTACAIFLYFPIYNINDGGVGSVATAQGAAMTTKGTPNDLLSNFNPLVIIIAVPILTYGVYPLLARFGIKFGRISRILFGFWLAVACGVCGAVTQYYVYETSPCGYQASNCDGGVSPISVWVQTPQYVLSALSECFCNVTAYELAYARSPPGMKAIVVAIFLFMTALSSALGEVLTPVIKDPYLIWVWAGPAIALAVQNVIFWFRYRHINNEAFMTYEEAVPGVSEPQAVEAGEAPAARDDGEQTVEGGVKEKEVKAET